MLIVTVYAIFVESIATASQVAGNKLPIIAAISGTRHESGKPDTPLYHAIVIDGYKRIYEIYIATYRCGAPDSGQYKYIPYTYSYEYIAMNWGYDGSGQVKSNGSTVWYNTKNTMGNSPYQGAYDEITSFYDYIYGFKI